ncbi:MAG: hypothetical protein Q4C79_12750, partial [Neisseria sp.]|uniref:hypothetical protein n=1 Tax=Neisseria sp. TaxID=192066 RepID=UPI0026DADCD3
VLMRCCFEKRCAWFDNSRPKKLLQCSRLHALKVGNKNACLKNNFQTGICLKQLPHSADPAVDPFYDYTKITIRLRMATRRQDM